MARSALSPGRVRRSVSHGNLDDAGMCVCLRVSGSQAPTARVEEAHRPNCGRSLRDRSLTPVSQRVLDVARKSRDNRMLQLYPKNTNMTSPPTVGVVWCGVVWCGVCVCVCLPCSSRAGLHHANMQRRPARGSPAAARGRRASWTHALHRTPAPSHTPSSGDRSRYPAQAVPHRVAHQEASRRLFVGAGQRLRRR